MALFITLEGGEGSGKSTAAKGLLEKLQAQDIPFILTREPGGTKIAEQIRSIILDKNNKEMDPKTEALLYAASRRQHLVEKVIPAIKSGTNVLCDRFLDSSLAYQGNARGLGIDEILSVNLFALNNEYPDLTIFFDLKPEEGLKRIENNSRNTNRLDLELLAFHKKVYEGYQLLIERFKDRFVVIDASKSREEIVDECYKIIMERLNK